MKFGKAIELDILFEIRQSGLEMVEKDMRRREFLASTAALSVAPILPIVSAAREPSIEHYIDHIVFESNPYNDTWATRIFMDEDENLMGIPIRMVDALRSD